MVPRLRRRALSAVAPGWCASLLAYASHSALVWLTGRFCGTGGCAWILRCSLVDRQARTAGSGMGVMQVRERGPQNLLLDLGGLLLLLEGLLLFQGKRGLFS